MMSRRIPFRGLTALAIVVLLAAPCWSGTILEPVDFGTNTFGATFWHVSTPGNVAYNGADDGGFGPGGFIEHPATTTSHRAFVYDTDDAVGGPGQTFTDVTVDLDFRANNGGAGVGFYFHGTRTNTSWAFFQIDDSQVGGNDRVRFFWDRNATAGTGSGAAAGSSDRNADTALSLNDWVHVRLDVQNVNAGTQVEATLSAWPSQIDWSGTPAFSETFTYSAAQSNTSAGEVGISIFHGSAPGQAVDNIALYDFGTGPDFADLHIPLTGATQTFSPSASLSANASIDGVFSSASRGWAISNNTGIDQTAVFPAAAPLDTAGLGKLTFVLEGNDVGGAAKHILGKFRLSATDDADPTVTSGADWTVLEPTAVAALANSLTINGDGSIIAGTANIPTQDTYTVDVGVPAGLSQITGFRLEALADAALPGPGGGGPGLADNGNFVLSNFAVTAAVPEPATGMLAVLGGLFLMVLGRRKRRR